MFKWIYTHKHTYILVSSYVLSAPRSLAKCIHHKFPQLPQSSEAILYSRIFWERINFLYINMCGSKYVCLYKISICVCHFLNALQLFDFIIMLQQQLQQNQLQFTNHHDRQQQEATNVYVGVIYQMNAKSQ